MQVSVSMVKPGGAFSGAGILPGDILTRINGEPIRFVNHFRRIETRLKPGTRVRVSVYRGRSGKSLQFDVTVGADTSSPVARPAEFSWRGARLTDITEDMRRKSLAFTANGVYVADVNGPSRTYAAGLRPGDVIVQVNDTVVKSLSDFRKALEGIPETSVVRIRTTDGITHVKGENAGK